jgi:hypothetical protein
VFETVMVYGPPGLNPLKLKFPESLVTDVLVEPVGSCSTTTVAPATFTEPATDDVVDWAYAAEIMKTERKDKINFFIILLLSTIRYVLFYTLLRWVQHN